MFLKEKQQIILIFFYQPLNVLILGKLSLNYNLAQKHLLSFTITGFRNSSSHQDFISTQTKVCVVHLCCTSCLSVKVYVTILYCDFSSWWPLCLLRPSRVISVSDKAEFFLFVRNGEVLLHARLILLLEEFTPLPFSRGCQAAGF